MTRRPDQPAERVAAMQPFLTMEIAERAFALQRSGVDVAHLGFGEPDFPPPPEAVEGQQLSGAVFDMFAFFAAENHYQVLLLGTL